MHQPAVLGTLGVIFSNHFPFFNQSQRTSISLKTHIWFVFWVFLGEIACAIYFEIFTLKIKRPKKLKKIIHTMVFLWAPIYITRQPGYQIQIRFEMWRDLNCECLFIRTNLIVHKGNGAEISEFSKGFVRRVKWKGPLNWIDHQKSLRFLTAVSSCLLPCYIRDFYILRWFDDSCAIRWPSVLSYGVS